jgi:DNA-binding response OmpR family regulator
MQIYLIDYCRILQLKIEVYKSFKMVLEDEGYEVDEFTDSLIDLSKFKRGIYELLILGIKMPCMDGFNLYKQIKKLDDKIKVCFLTASQMYYENYRSKEYSLNEELFIHKPIENDEFINKIKKIIGS